MAVKILHKRSAVEFKSATGAQLEFGELGLNYNESGPYLQCKDAAGEIVQLGGVYIGTNAPGNELKGAWWLRDSDNTLFLFDGTSWVSIAGGSGGGGGSTTVIGSDGIEATTVGDVVTVKVDLASPSNGLSIVGGKLAADIATTSSLGTVKVGSGLAVAADGTLSATGGGGLTEVDLDYTAAVDKGTVTNTAGDDATIPLADDTNAGLFTAAEKTKLAGIEDGAEVNDGYDKTESDGRYLRVDAAAPAQTRVAGTTTFTEQISVGPDVDGAEVRTRPGLIEIIQPTDGNSTFDSAGTISFQSDGKAEFDGVTTHNSGIDLLKNNAPNIITDSGAIVIQVDGTSGRSINIGRSPSTTFNCSTTTAKEVDSATTVGFQSTAYKNTGYANNDAEIKLYNANFASANDLAGVNKAYGYFAVCNKAVSAANETYGYYSSIEINDGGKDTWNFYAAGNAPSYFSGLTEHASGVKVTGGTAATASLFSTVDGDINLANKHGDILFKSQKTSAGTSQLSAINNNTIPNIGCAIRHQTNDVLNAGLRSSLKAGSVNTEVRNFDSHFTSDSDFSSVTRYTQFNGSITSTPALAVGANQYVFKVNNFDGLGDSQAATGANNYAFYCAVNPNNDGSKKNYSYYAAGLASSYFAGELVVKANSTAGNNGFIKCKANNANTPQLFVSKEGGPNSTAAIAVYADGAQTWSVAFNGTAAFSAISGALRDVHLEMDADDPAAFTTTFALAEDAEGNQVQEENTVYSGATESLLEIIKDLRARVAALEAAQP